MTRSHISTRLGRRAHQAHGRSERLEPARELLGRRACAVSPSVDGARVVARGRLELPASRRRSPLLAKYVGGALAVAGLVEVRRRCAPPAPRRGRRASARARGPAAACISRAASGVSASTTTSRMIGDVKRSSLGPVCTRKSRVLQRRRPSARARHAAARACVARTADVDGIAQHRGRLQRRLGRAASSRATRDATRPRSVFGSASSWPTSFIVTTRPLGDGHGVARRRSPLMTSSMNSGWPPARVAHEAHELVGRGVDAEAQRDEPLDVVGARGRRGRGPRARRALLERVREAGARGEGEDDARVLQPLRAPRRGSRSCPRPSRARRPTRTCAAGPRRGSAPCARTRGAASAFALPE